MDPSLPDSSSTATPGADQGTERQESPDIGRSRSLSRAGNPVPGKAPGYEIIRSLGEGSFGSVWLANETKTGRQVAIKFYSHRRGLDWSLLSREVEKLAVLYTSRNIVGLLDVGWDHDPPFFVMEYLEPGPLSTRLSLGPLPVDDAVRIARGVLSALTHAHNSGILHCDVKPANVLMDSGGSPRLGDFGQSRLSTEQSPALGTLYYMAPEQAVLDGIPDARWDVYALGALLYHMLTGSPPYRTPESEHQIRRAGSLEERLKLYRRLLAESARPDQHRRVKGVDSRLAEIIDGCLERDPLKRLPNAQIVLDLLDQREQALSKRPLMILGVIGPVLFLATLLAVSAFAIPKAVRTAENNLVDRALDSDADAAKILAASIQQEFDVRLKELEDVADQIASKNDPGGEVFRDDLQTMLGGWCQTAAQRLKDQNRTPDDSVFVCNARGIQVFREPHDDSLGRDFAWRDYFHGQQRELPEGEHPPPRPKAGISLAYRSSTSRLYKVAVAVPVWNASRERVIGVLARTVNLSDLLSQWEARIRKAPSDTEAMLNPASGARTRFLALVDMRESPPYLLDHPWMSDAADVPTGEEYKSRLQLSGEEADLLRPPRDRSSRYVDPIGRIDPRYARPWLAAYAPVGTTGWIAVVQEDREVALDPVNALRSVFVRYGLSALAAVVLVFALLWMLLRRAAK